MFREKDYDLKRKMVFLHYRFRVQTSRNDKKVVVIPEWLYQVSIYLFRVFYLMGDQTNLDKPIIHNIEDVNKEKLIEDIKKVINYY